MQLNISQRTEPFPTSKNDLTQRSKVNSVKVEKLWSSVQALMSSQSPQGLGKMQILSKILQVRLLGP